MANDAIERREDLASDELTACVGNLVSLLALPSLCHDRNPSEILELTLDALGRLLDFDLGYMRLAEPEGADMLRLSRDEKYPLASELEQVRAFVQPLLVLPPLPAGTQVEAPCGLGSLRVLALPIGFYAETGHLLLASRREDFPRTSELIQARGAASLVASAIENAQARLKVEQVHRELEAASRAKDEFLAMLGHELRNPLTPIVTALQLMKLRGADGGKERAIIERQVQHMRQLVDDLLDISRITRGMVELKPQRMEIAEIIAKSIEVASPLLERRRHHLAVHCPARGFLVEVDPVRCAQVVSNLLTNAAKYTEPGGSISISVEREPGWLSIRVRDSGIGISPQMLPRVFDPFAQERRALDRAEGGLGLGLAIVKNLVALHRGTVEVQSGGLGHGSEFIVRLPAATATVASTSNVPSASTNGELPAVNVAASASSVLVVDDNVDAGDLLADVVSSLGYRVAVARDGAEGLRAARDMEPALVILDIGLPVMDGYEVAQRIRELPTLRPTRLIALTGYGQDSDRRRSAAAGFDAHLVKPVDIDELEEVIRDLLLEAD